MKEFAVNDGYEIGKNGRKTPRVCGIYELIAYNDAENVDTPRLDLRIRMRAGFGLAARPASAQLSTQAISCWRGGNSILGGEPAEDDAVNKAGEANFPNADEYVTQGTAYYRKGEHERAIADFEKAIALDPGHADAYFGRGAAYARKSNYDRAIADFEKAIALDPGHADAYFKRGAAYALKDERDHATNDFNKAIELNAQHDDAHFDRAAACASSINFDEYRIDEPRKAPLAARLMRCVWGGEKFYDQYCKNYNELVDSLEECVKHKDMTPEEALRKLEQCRKI